MITRNKDYIKGEIKPVYLQNAIAWTLSNCDITSREEIPQLFGGVGGNPVQQVYVEELARLLDLK